jgi:hypothetical protein
LGTSVTATIWTSSTEVRISRSSITSFPRCRAVTCHGLVA